MPLYAYACAKCGERFDTLKSLKARKEPEPCPKCGTAADRAMSGYSVAGCVGSSTSSLPSFSSAPSSCGSGGG